MNQLANQRVVYLNGEIVPESEALIPFRDRGFRYGDAVFDMTRTFGHRIFRLQEHIDRFYKSLRYTQIDSGISPAKMIAITEEVLERNLHLLEADDDYWVGQRISRGARPCRASSASAISRKFVSPLPATMSSEEISRITRLSRTQCGAAASASPHAIYEDCLNHDPDVVKMDYNINTYVQFVDLVTESTYTDVSRQNSTVVMRWWQVEHKPCMTHPNG